MIDITFGAFIVCALLTIGVKIRAESTLSFLGILLSHTLIAEIFGTTLDAIRIVILAELTGIAILVVCGRALQTGIECTEDTLVVESSTVKTFTIF